MRIIPTKVPALLMSIFCVCACVRADDDVFPIMSWELPARNVNFSDPKHGLESLKDCGFTVAGFVRPEHLAECEKLGMKAIISPAKVNRQWAEMTDQQINEAVDALVRDGQNSPVVIGFFLMDEPGVKNFPALAKAARRVKSQAPGKLAYINLFPDYATLGAPDLSQLGTSNYTEYLERFVKEVKPQFISYDNYRVQYSHDLKSANIAASYYNNLLEVRRVAMEHQLPFWNIVSSNQIRKEMPPPSPANLLFQAYTTLAAGARGLTWYTYYSGGYAYAPVDKVGHLTPSWSYLKMVNDQVKVLGPTMLKLKSTDVYFSTPPAAGLPNLPGEIVKSIDSEAPVMVGEFSGENDQRWVMLVNLSLERSAKIEIGWKNPKAVAKTMSPVDGTLEELLDNTIRLVAGQGVLVRVE